MKLLDLRKQPFYVRFRLIAGLVIAVIVLAFLWLKVLPFGHISYARDFGNFLRSGKGFIYSFTPEERVNYGKRSVTLTGDPVYFSVFTPRTFSRARLTVTYRDHLKPETPVIEAGVLADNIIWRYQLKPLDNKSLDYLRLRWNATQEDGRLFLQRDKLYSSLAEWEKDLKAGHLKGCNDLGADCLAIYNYSPDYDFRLTNYRSGLPLTIDQPLRGGHQFYIYLDNEPLRLGFSFIDRNQDRKAAPIEVIVTKGDEVVASGKLDDPNLKPGSGQEEEKKLVIEKKGLPAGAYKVEVKITDDMVIKRIESSVSRLSFYGKVWPVSGQGGLTLYTDTNYVLTKILNPASLGPISFSGKQYELDTPYSQSLIRAKDEKPVHEIRLNKDDIILENGGVFAFSPESLINPSLPKIDRFFSVKTPARYIVAGYQSPENVEGLVKATAEFDLKGTYRESGKYSFMISVPGLRSDDGIADSLEIEKIEINFEGRTLWQKISGRQ